MWFLVTALLASFLSDVAFGLDQNKNYSQYLHHQWTPSNGFPAGRINSISQTADGYLWLATSNGLVRFDGFRFVLFGRSNSVTEPITNASTVVSDKDGSLWVLDQGMNVQRYDHGKFDYPTASSGTERRSVLAMTASIRGGLVAATLGPRLVEYFSGRSQAFSGTGKLSLAQPQTIAQTSDGKVWMATYEEGLYYLENGKVTLLKEGMPDSKINCLLPIENGGLWIATDNGLVLWNGKKISTTISAESLHQARVLSLAKDRDHNIWIGTSGGLFRLSSDGLQAMQGDQEGSLRTITAIYEDRENNLWIADTHGIERLSDGLFVTYSSAGSLAKEINGPVYVDSVHRAWVGTSGGGLAEISHRAVVPVRAKALGRDTIYSIAGTGNDIWIGRRNGGLTHLRHLQEGAPGLTPVATYTHLQGLAENSVSSVFISRDGAIWAGTLSGGVSRLKGGRFVTFTSSNGLGSNTVSSIQEGADGAMWFATSGGLSRWLNGQWKTFTSEDGLPSDELTTLAMDSSGILWIGTSSGLAYLSSDASIRTVSLLLPTLRESVLGIADDGRGYLWITTSSHVLRVSRSALLLGKLRFADHDEYGGEDGLVGTAGVQRERSVVADPGGAIWLVTTGGVSMLDLNRLKSSVPQAPPHVEALTSDGRQSSLESKIQLGPAPQRITIEYIAVSLSRSDRVRYRYRLDGFERVWSDPTEQRQVVYTNLRPGSYRFDLMAFSNDGSTIGPETELPFTIRPTLLQSWWTQAFLGLLLIAAAWVFYLYRLRVATSRILERLDAQMEERARISRELHDTLLQGFQGLTLRIQSALNNLPHGTQAYAIIEQVLDRADQVLVEGRESVQGLRTSDVSGDGLSNVLMRFGEELMQGTSLSVTMEVVGTPQTLCAPVFEETSRIAKEALINCLQHAKASQVEVEMTYGHSTFCLMIRDNGIGIDATVVQQGRMGHWGLSGMRERARKIGGEFSIWTTPGAGTEIELIIPARVAYPSTLRRSFWRRLVGRGSG